MIKIFDCSSRSFNRVRFWLGLAVLPLVPLDEQLSAGKTWRGFEAKEPILTLVQARRWEGEEAAPLDCREWAKVLALLPLDTRGWKADGSAWGAWDQKAIEQVNGCVKFPCLVKMNASEVKQLSELPEPKRVEHYVRLMNLRANQYLKDSSRPAFEWPETRTEPWSELEKSGLSSSALRPSLIELVARRLDIAPGQMKPIRQILDRRLRGSPTEASLWVRDVVNDHYFDAWGEWIRVECRPARAAQGSEPAIPQRVQVTAGLLMEVDHFKHTDLLARLGRPKVRWSVEEYGHQYLTRTLDFLRSAALQASQGSPVPVAPSVSRD